MQYAKEEPEFEVGIEQMVTIDAEDGVVINRVVHAQADQPAERWVVVALLNELSLAEERAKDLHEQCAQQPFGRNQREPGVRVTMVDLRTHVGESVVDQRPQGAQWVVLRHALIQARVT